MAEQVLYHPPKSMSFGHPAGGRDARAAWQAVERFLTTHTISLLRDRVEFQCPLPSDGLDETVAREYLDYVTDKLGPQTSTGAHHVWSMDPQRLSLCLEVVFGEDRWPKQRFGPARLVFCYDFVWRRVAGEHASVERDGPRGEVPKSSFLNVLIGSQRVFVQPMFFFPFCWDSTEIKELLKTVSVDLPFRFSPHHFQRVMPSKQGNSYRALKLPKDWFQPG